MPTRSATSRCGTTAASSAGSPRADTDTASASRSRWATFRRRSRRRTTASKWRSSASGAVRCRHRGRCTIRMGRGCGEARVASRPPRCIVIAGPNGAGKTTFARDFLPNEASVIDFVNADLIASGLSPLKPEDAAVTAARILLAELDRLVRARASFAFESTLAGIGHAARLRRMKRARYRIEIVYLKLGSAQLALQRIR